MGKIVIDDSFYISGRGTYIIVNDPDNLLWINTYYIDDLEIDIRGYKNINNIAHLSNSKEVSFFCDEIDSLPVKDAKEFIKNLIGKELINEDDYKKINRNKKIDDIIK